MGRGELLGGTARPTATAASRQAGTERHRPDGVLKGQERRGLTVKPRRQALLCLH